jgi:primosomal protein N' (replication factor Y)
MTNRQVTANLLGPAPAPIAKLRGKFRFHILLIDRTNERLREVVRAATSTLTAPDEVLWTADVDPLDMM